MYEYTVTPCCKLKDLTTKTPESLSWSTVGVESEEQSHHPACECVRADPKTQAGVGCRGELVVDFACFAGLLWHRNQNLYGRWLSSSEFDQQLWENISFKYTGVGRYFCSWSASFQWAINPKSRGRLIWNSIAVKGRSSTSTHYQRRKSASNALSIQITSHGNAMRWFYFSNGLQGE